MITDLQATTLALDFRVTVLEENGGGDGNSSAAELEVRVETLEGTAADHETRISATKSDLTGRYHNIVPFFEVKRNSNVSNVLFKWKRRLYNEVLILDLEETVTDQETRLTVAEENIQGRSTSIRHKFP